MKLKVSLKNNLIAILDQTFPSVNTMFTSSVRADGSEKWEAFVERFWHCEVVSYMSRAGFIDCYNKRCLKHGYNRSDSKAHELYNLAKAQIATLPCTDGTKALVTKVVAQLNSISSTLANIKSEMMR